MCHVTLSRCARSGRDHQVSHFQRSTAPQTSAVRVTTHVATGARQRLALGRECGGVLLNPRLNILRDQVRAGRPVAAVVENDGFVIVADPQHGREPDGLKRQDESCKVLYLV
jgi:hypothetical protein